MPYLLGFDTVGGNVLLDSQNALPWHHGFIHSKDLSWVITLLASSQKWPDLEELVLM